MLDVEKGIGGGDWDRHEQWFERAMRANGDNKMACECKLDWLEPKWYGSREALLAFGRACRETGNWQSGITLLAAEARRCAAGYLPNDERKQYYASDAVWNEIRDVYQEYLEHFPADHEARSEYAVYCYLSGKYPESLRQFRILNKDLRWSRKFPEDFVKQIRSYVAFQAGAGDPLQDEPRPGSDPAPAKIELP
jgi:hypothetical protein